MEDVIKLPEERVNKAPAKRPLQKVPKQKREKTQRRKNTKSVAKRPPAPPPPPPAEPKQKEENTRRRKNTKSVAVLGDTRSSVKLLEDLVFGGEDELLERIAENDKADSRSLWQDEDSDLSQSDDEDDAPRPAKVAAWVDEDDELEEVIDMKHRYRKDLMKGEAESTMSKKKLQQRMKEQFQRAMGGTPSWADISSKKKKKKTKKKTSDDEEEEEEEEEDEDDLLRRTGNFVASSDTLPSGILKMKKCLHANSARPSEDRLTTVQFHPSAQVVMTAGLDQSISLFQVDGKTNPKIQSIHLDRFPVHRAQFSLDGETVIATSLKNKMFYLYDMMEGRIAPVHTIRGLNEARVKDFSVCPDGGALLLSGTNGYLHMVTLKTKEVVSSMKMNGNVCGVAFSHDGSKVFANSEEGEVYVWDLRSSRCVNRFTDDGCVRGTSIAASRNGQYLACGSQSGVVNVYLQEACLNSGTPKPLKAVMNLLTTATSLTFNPTSEILAIASRAEDEAIRLVHMPSLTVFSNFPISKKKIIYRASCLDFSPHSGFFSVANNKGLAPLYRLLHYQSF